MVSERCFTTAAVLAYFMIFMIHMTYTVWKHVASVAEEKSSRIMEVMIAKVKPMELMFGKFSVWVP